MNKKIILSFIFFTFGLSFAVFSDEQLTPAEILDMAESAFKNGMELLDSNPNESKEYFREASVYYKSLIDSGIRNFSLYYNLGNTYYRLNKIGFAILNYRRALLYSPGDRQVRYNLDYVRTLQKNGFDIDTRNEILHIIFFLHYLLPVEIKVVILIIFNFSFWGLFVLLRFGRSLKTPFIISLIILLLSSVSVFIDFRESRIFHGVVTADTAIGRLGDSRSYEQAFDGALYQGVEFTIIQNRPGWLLAKLPNDELVWLEKNDCGIVEE